MNKKAELLHDEVIFIILVIVFYSILLLFVSRAGTGASFVEQNYAKKISYLIDQTKPGTYIELEVNEIFATADKKQINRQETIKIDPEKRTVTIKASQGTGYSHSFFSGNNIKWGLNTKTGILVLEII